MKYEKKIKKVLYSLNCNYLDNEYKNMHVSRKGKPFKLPENLKMLYDKLLKYQETKK